MTSFPTTKFCLPPLPALLLCLLTSLLAGCSSPSPHEKHYYTVGVLNYSKAAEKALAGFKEGMTKLGYREGENITYLYAGHIPDREKLRDEARELLQKNIDLLYTMSTPATLIAKEMTTNNPVPVVFGPVSNPVESGIVGDLKSPERNITGVTFKYQEPKRLQLLQEIAPAAHRIAFPFNPDDPSPQFNLQEITAIAAELGVTLVPCPLRNNDEINAFLTALPADIDAIYMPTDSFMATRAKDFIATALERGLPLTTPIREGVQAGALFSYGISLHELGVQASRLADQLLRGISPRDLPVEIAEFEIAVNLRTAEAIGINLPDSLLRRAIVIQ
ncbi:MAG: ABC transporter substrate-binding protein [Thermodesulfobacteriota bacterium]